MTQIYAVGQCSSWTYGLDSPFSLLVSQFSM